jgi:hypothetical protein
MSTHDKKWLQWTPRIIAILYILFLALFALDVIQPEYSFWEILGGLFMHLIPNFLLLAALIIAWRWPMVGGSLFLILGVIGTFRYQTYDRLDTFLLISLPVFVIGFLFIAYDFFNHQKEEIGAS